MNALSLQWINTYSPYKVELGESNVSFGFTTDFGVDYSIDFVADDLISSDESSMCNYNNNYNKLDILTSPSHVVFLFISGH